MEDIIRKSDVSFQGKDRSHTPLRNTLRSVWLLRSLLLYSIAFAAAYLPARRPKTNASAVPEPSIR